MFESPAASVLKPSASRFLRIFGDKSNIPMPAGERESEFTEVLDTPGLRVNKGTEHGT